MLKSELILIFVKFCCTTHFCTNMSVFAGFLIIFWKINYTMKLYIKNVKSQCHKSKRQHKQFFLNVYKSKHIYSFLLIDAMCQVSVKNHNITYNICIVIDFSFRQSNKWHHFVGTKTYRFL